MLINHFIEVPEPVKDRFYNVNESWLVKFGRNKIRKQLGEYEVHSLRG